MNQVQDIGIRYTTKESGTRHSELHGIHETEPNEKKTKWMLFNDNTVNNVIFTLNNTVIERVYAFTYLGLTLDPELKFIVHKETASRNIRYKIQQLGRIRKYVDEDTALDIYKGMVLPSFDYVDFVGDRDNVGENRDLQYIQNKALRCIYKVKLEEYPRLNTIQLHEESNCKQLMLRAVFLCI